jgi:hypothetical protein
LSKHDDHVIDYNNVSLFEKKHNAPGSLGAMNQEPSVRSHAASGAKTPKIPLSKVIIETEAELVQASEEGSPPSSDPKQVPLERESQESSTPSINVYADPPKVLAQESKSLQT